MANHIKSLIVNISVAVLFYLWQFHGYEWCGNVVLFVLWLRVVIWILCGLINELRPDARQSKALIGLQTTCTVFFALWLAAIGYFVTAGFLAASCAAWAAFNDRVKKGVD